MIFARNGVGKSFLSRAFYYLDLHKQGKKIDDAAFNLVSEESPNAQAKLIFRHGNDVLGSLDLNKITTAVSAACNDTIFHVFSDDFVQTELRVNRFKINSDIPNEIAVDSDKIDLKDAQKAVNKADKALETSLKQLSEQFTNSKEQKLVHQANVNRNLREFRDITFEKLGSSFPTKPEAPAKTFQDHVTELDKLKSVPTDPNCPNSLSEIEYAALELSILKEQLELETSLSSVAEEVKAKIEKDTEFYRAGIKHTHERQDEVCPFCEQDVSAAEPKAVIEAYIAYFDDNEQKHKQALSQCYKRITAFADTIDNFRKTSNSQRKLFDDLKAYFPSTKSDILSDVEQNCLAIEQAIESLKSTVEKKADNLANAILYDIATLESLVAQLNDIIIANNVQVTELITITQKVDEERKTLQRGACRVFLVEFAIEYWEQLEAFDSYQIAAREKKTELAAAEKRQPSTQAKKRVADTFKLVLRHFFAEKYTFDEDEFVVKRDHKTMSRGPDRTLSDGEKTALAFCYFIASIHRKVAANADYKRLYLVFDDPVTSMSFDYVFAIAQVLKDLGISNQGDIEINAKKIAKNKIARPKLLMLTHSSYFFNIAKNNRVVKSEAAFSLSVSQNKHRIHSAHTYVAPFKDQLRDIYEIDNGTKEPDHHTGNSIRSVLEAIGRFCQPDECDQFTNFLSFLIASDDIQIKGTMINSMSHGTYVEETPTNEDIKIACRETLLVVKKYAKGQLAVIEKEVQ